MGLPNKISLRVFIHTFAGVCQKLKSCRVGASFTFVGGALGCPVCNDQLQSERNVQVSDTRDDEECDGRRLMISN